MSTPVRGLRFRRSALSLVTASVLAVGGAVAPTAADEESPSAALEPVLLLTNGEAGFLSDLDGSDVTRLTATHPATSQFFRDGAISPGGDLLAVGDGFQLSVSYSDGACPFDIPTGRAVEATPSFAPDGQSVALTSADIEARWVLNQRVDIFDIGSGTVRTVAEGQTPDWSPDGQQLVYSSARHTAPGVAVGGDVRVVNRAGTGDLSLGVTGTSPAWSPDGTMIAYVDDSGRLALIDLETRAQRAVITEITDVVGPVVWSPDGNWLFFNRAPGAGVWRVRPDGREVQRILPGERQLRVQDAADRDLRTPDRYRILHTDGTVRDFGARCGPQGATRAVAGLGGRPVAIASTADGGGSWVVTTTGAVATFGSAPLLGGMDDRPLRQPIVGIDGTATGRGYHLVASDGGVFAFGDARFYGSTGGVRLNRPVVGMATTPSGQGYYLVASDGGVFAFGDARFYGSTGGVRLNRPVVGMATTPSGRGYYLVASDGGVFAFGDARFYGSTGGMRLSRPVIGTATTPSGGGYYLVASDGGVFTFGDARFQGASPGAVEVVDISS